jgi:murein DD-endopeptidase MepM/ murein hydrolase activator NlpD
MKRLSSGTVCLLSLALSSFVLPEAVFSSTPEKFVRPATRAKRKQARVALKGHLAHVSHEMNTVRAKLKQAKRSEADIAEELVTIRRRLQSTRLRLSQTRAHLAASKREQQKVAQALQASQRRLDRQEMQLSHRMAANYRQGPVRYASVLLGARSMGEMVTRAHFVRSVVNYDARLVAEIKKGRAEVLAWKAQVDRKTAQVAGLQKDLSVRQSEELEDVLRQRQVLAEARARRAEFEDDLDALREDSATITARLHALQETPVGRARQMIAFSGGLIRPVGARIISGFGMRFHPILHYSRLHAGVDFASGTGTPIAASGSGVVVFSGVMRGYGNVVVIDHGGGISTLYGHCSARLVQDGESVSKGQIIARVGSTGLATGPHLHFEVRKNGAPVNPQGAF